VAYRQNRANLSRSMESRLTNAQRATKTRNLT
jgi:hypothetical protein